jgi:thiamine biosynthesis lipoprotein ApbE
VVALRSGRCDVAAEQFVELWEFGIEPADVPRQLVRCRRGEKVNVEGP